jgi:hypothetical protein
MTLYAERDIPTIIRIWMKIFNGKQCEWRPPYYPTPRNDGLHFLSLFCWLYARGKIRGKLDVAIDKWVIICSLLLFPTFILYTFFSECIGLWGYILILLGILRVVEICVVQAGLMIFDRYQRLLKTGKYTVRSLHRLALLLVHNYFEIIFWFALFYRFLQVNYHSIDFGKYSISSFLDVLIRIFHFSFFQMSTFGQFNDITGVKVSGLSVLLILVQTIIGLYMTLLIFARFVGSMPVPRSEDKFEIPKQ